MTQAIYSPTALILPNNRVSNRFKQVIVHLIAAAQHEIDDPSRVSNITIRNQIQLDVLRKECT